MSTNCRMFLCDNSLSSLISRSAVMGNCRWLDHCVARLASKKRAYPILLVMHDDLLERDMGSGLPRLCSVNLARKQGSARRRDVPGCGHLPECSLAQLAQELVVVNPRAPNEARPVPLMLNCKGPIRRAAVRCARLHDDSCAARRDAPVVFKIGELDLGRCNGKCD